MRDAGEDVLLLMPLGDRREEIKERG